MSRYIPSPSPSLGTDSVITKLINDYPDEDEECSDHEKNRFFEKYGTNCENVNWDSFGLESDFLPRLVSLNFGEYENFKYLVESCRKLRLYSQTKGDILTILHGHNDDILGRFAFACISAIHRNRSVLKDHLLLTYDSSDPTIVLLEVVRSLIDHRNTAIYLLENNIYILFREVLETGQGNIRSTCSSRTRSSLEGVLGSLLHCPHSERDRSSFISNILSLSFLWKLIPNLKEDLIGHEMLIQCVRQISTQQLTLRYDHLTQSSGDFCLLANVLELAAIHVSRSHCSVDTAEELLAVTIHSLTNFCAHDKTVEIHPLLESQILNVIDSHFLKDLIKILLSRTTGDGSCGEENRVGRICSLLELIFINLPYEGTATALACGTKLISVLWGLNKRLHKENKWEEFSRHSIYIPENAPGWLCALLVFCPLYKSKLTVDDHDKLILSTEDLILLIKILKQDLLQLMWLDPDHLPDLTKPTTDFLSISQQPLGFFRHKVAGLISVLLWQLNEWNIILKFADPEMTFSALDGDNWNFFYQVVHEENHKALNILKSAPFLVPFIDRVKIFNAWLNEAKSSYYQVVDNPMMLVRRTHIVEDGFSRFPNKHLENDILITYVDMHGRTEKGVDAGGLFKDFIDKFTRAVFAKETGLFKATEDSDNCYYPEPNSTTEEHLRKYYVLGKIIAKALYTGISIGIPFAVFFLRKLKKRHNYFRDMPSMDSALYRSLFSLKKQPEGVSDLSLDFTVSAPTTVNPAKTYELLKGGKDLPVREENVNELVHLTADYQLNFQISQQSTYFQKGFEVLIPPDWTDMFNENEFQLLLSGPVGLDIADFKAHVELMGYNEGDNVIVWLSDVLKEFDAETQGKFLRFVTGCSRVPVLGFVAVDPKISILRLDKPPENLPESATCSNTLKLLHIQANSNWRPS